MKIEQLKVSKFTSPAPELVENFGINEIPVFVAGDTVLAVSVATLAIAKHNKQTDVPVIKIAEEYTEILDLQYLNMMRGVITRYHEIRDSFSGPEELKNAGFDSRELDFMYNISLEDEKYDIKILESDSVVLKREQCFNVKCKTREENIIIRRYFKTINHEIDFDKFYKIMTNQLNSLASMFGEEEDEIPTEKLEVNCETNFRIRYENDEQLKEIFKLFKLSPKKKIIRVYFGKIKELLK